MTSKHTPGPWVVNQNAIVYGSNGVRVKIGLLNRETVANARLIAMAPRMYEVLRLAKELDVDGYNLLDVQIEAQAILNELETDQ